MKTYRVTISDETLAGVEKHLDYLAEQTASEEIGVRWWERALEKIFSLEKLPNRCPLAPENEFEELEIRMLLVGSCLFLYTVDEPNRVVRILKFRHGSQEARPL